MRRTKLVLTIPLTAPQSDFDGSKGPAISRNIFCERTAHYPTRTSRPFLHVKVNFTAADVTDA